jgi:glucosamine--fructose-6-phosphate aminotransferase (isomerizing)
MMFESYLEVFEQGKSLRQTFDFIKLKENDIVNFFKDSEYEEVVFLACGSSYWLSSSACMTMQEKLGVRCTAVKSGDVVMNPEYYKKAYKKPLVIAPSRSGTTTETLAAVGLFKETFGSSVLCVVEYKDPPIQALSDLTIEIPWANEVSVCQTRSFSNLYLVCIMLSALVCADKALLLDLDRYISDFAQHQIKAESILKSIISEFPQCGSLVTLGSGKQYGLCIEGAYIAIEMAQFPSNYYGLLEFRHGPIVMADDSMLVAIFSNGNGKEHEEKMAAETKQKGAKVAMICTEGGYLNADYCFSLGRKAEPETVALFGIMVMQGYAHLKAVDMGVDPDHPKDLIPWISL